MKRGKIIIVILILGLLAVVLFNFLSGKKLEKLSKMTSLEYLDQARARLSGDGSICIGIIKDGKMSLEYYNKNGRLENPPKVKYELASITKTMTAGMIYELIKEDKLTLDDRIDQYFDLELEKSPKIKDIICHKAGFKSVYIDGINTLFNPLKDFTYEDGKKIVEKSKFTGQEDFEYSNFSYGILGHIIERVSGKSYEENLRAYLEKYYGMKDTVTIHEDEKRYFSWGEDSFYKPAGAVVASFDDMLKYLQGSMERYEKEPGAFELMASYVNEFPLIKKFGIDFTGISYAWLYDKELNIYAHPGELETSSSFIAFEPEKKIGVLVLINQEPSNELFAKLLGAKIIRESIGK